MNFWLFILIMIVVLAMLAGGYMTICFHRFAVIKRIAKKNRLLAWLAALIPLLILVGVALMGNLMSIIVGLHLAAIFLICNIAAFIIKKIAAKRDKRTEVQKEALLNVKPIRPYIAGIIAIILTAVYMLYGWANAHNIVETDYEVVTEKLAAGESLRIAQITDVHIGTTFDGERFRGYILEINETNPDILTVTGDFVDHTSSYTDMVMACDALGDAKTKYGVYFIFGNHDLNAYGANPNFSSEQLITEIKKNDVVLLQDEAVLVDNRFYVAGRKDAVTLGRQTASDLLSGIDKSKYVVLLDHQPTDYAAEKEAGADLVLSGHTHGGQVFPAGIVGALISSNNMTYGIRRDEATTFIVNSGLSGWGFAFRTGVVAEYVIVDVAGGTLPK